AALLGAFVFSASPAGAGDDVYTITIKDHRFNPVDLEIPAGKKVKLVIKNLDSTPEEFESHELGREKIILGGREGVVYIGPLDPGTYTYFGEFNPETAQGRIIVK
ncbi:MAG: cupredoxin domain-containing protein, partial [Alphaproteobacteria bacterium]